MENWLINAVKEYGDHTAVLSESQSLTYYELFQKVKSANLSFKENLKPKSGEKIALILENRIEYIIIIHAFAFIDAIPVLINTRLTEKEIRWQLETINISKVIVSETTIQSLSDEFQNTWECYSVDSKPNKTEFLSLQLDDIVETPNSNLDTNKIQSLIFTSGTTGNPKPAIIKYSNIWASSQGSSERLGIEKNDIWMLTIPIYHVGGLSIIFRSCINGTTVFLDTKFSVDKIINLITRFKITILSLVPTMLRWLITDDSSSKTLAKLRLILLGGDSADTLLIEKSKKLNLQIATTYGMTESVSQVATAVSTTVYNKPLTVGRPLKGIEVKIVDDGGTICKPGQIGEIVLMGDPIIDGYYELPSKKFTNIGFFSGDIGYIDDDGDLFVLQRRVDLIVSGGENIYPSEVENHLRTIDRVQNACVIGINDEEWGQVPIAFIQSNSSENLENLIISSCKSHLAAFKIPKRFIFVDEYPRNSLGKIIRSELKNLIEK